jgi:hypothetical protein
MRVVPPDLIRLVVHRSTLLLQSGDVGVGFAERGQGISMLLTGGDSGISHSMIKYPGLDAVKMAASQTAAVAPTLNQNRFRSSLL